MTMFVPADNAGVAARFRNLFKPRDIFLHDGRNLRRFTVGAKVQLAGALVLLALLTWSAFATVQAVNAGNSDISAMERQVAKMEADVARMKALTRTHAELIEQRQAFLDAIVSGDADAEQLAELLPPAEAGHVASGSYAEVEGMQAALAERARAVTEQRVDETAKVLRRLGVNPAKFIPAAGGVGGPFEAVPAAQNADPRFKELFASWRRLEQLETAVAAIPSAPPLRNMASFTSGYGVRSDPFRGRAAMHAGVDLAGPVGTPIYATADGVIGRSEYAGAYGNLVEINHGQGIQTRYGHMSRRVAQAGQRVSRGDLIGYMGSTGRSTGSHLHYEVRIDGRAVNPIPFMQSNDMLLAMQNSSPISTPIALGGPSSSAR